MLIAAGTEVDYTVTYLEMTKRPSYPHPHLPANQIATLLRAVSPPAWYFLSLYDAVGRDYAWEDAHQKPEEETQAWLDDEGVELYTLMSQGWPQGFFIYDLTEAGTCELALFGLVPQAIGKGLGSFLLRTAILDAWDKPDVEKLSVNTCTLDHPRALQNYQKHGFVPVRRENHKRVLRRDRDLARIPD